MISRAALLAGGVCLGGSLAISVALTPLVRRWARQRDFVDDPGASSHKSHRRPVPFGGGIAITVAILGPMAATLLLSALLQHAAPAHWPVLSRLLPSWPEWAGGIVGKMPEGLAVIAGALILHLVGIVDDHRPLSPGVKLLFQLAVALMLTAGFGVRLLTHLGPAASVALTTLWIVGLTNAFNFLDNMDGLAAGVAALTAAVLAASALLAGQVFVPCTLLLLAGAVLGFLIYNFPPASIFMGDAGSLVIGYLLAVCTVLTTFYDPAQQRAPFGVLVPLLVFAIPLYDTGSVVVHRWWQGVNLFRGDQRHFSHRLVQLGMSRTAAVLTIYLATAATALPAVLLPMLQWGGALIIFAQCVCVIGIIAILEARHGR